MNRGFISALTALIIGIVSLVTAGGVYTVVKINNLEKENDRISEALVEQKETNKQEIISEVVSTTTKVVAKEDIVQEIEEVEVIEEKTPIITKQAKPAVVLPVESVAPTVPLPTIDNTVSEEATKKVEERKAYDLFLATILKADGELTLARTQLSEAMRVIYENPAIAETYAKESLNLCSSAHEININNMPSKLPFWIEMYKLYELLTQESSLCKQTANVFLQMIKYQESNNYPGAANGATEVISLNEKSEVVIKLKLEQLSIVDKERRNYFQD